MRRAVTLGLLVGCGPSLDAFLPEYVDGVCTLVLECTDPSVRTFDGTNTMDACLSSRGPSIVKEFEGCAYSSVMGKACLEAIDGVTCPDYVLTVEAVLPAECVTLLDACGAKDGLDTAR